jgi:hypothetical protein
MAVQINEVVIRAVIDPAPPASSPQATQCASENSSGSSAESELAEKILEIIREKLER